MTTKQQKIADLLEQAAVEHNDARAEFHLCRRMRQQAIRMARKDGLSWPQIGYLIGTSPAAAMQLASFKYRDSD